MKQIKVTLKTTTPLWTGDAWGENANIKTSSLTGSLRFWFEVICYFTGITNDNNYKDGRLKDEVNGDDFKKKIIHNGADFYAIDKTLAEMGVSLPSRIFGCTGWKGWIRIKEIIPIEDYCFGNRLNLPYVVTISKDGNFNIEKYMSRKDLNNFIDKRYKQEKKFKEKMKKFRKDFSVWYLAQPYFYGNLIITFEVEENIIEPIFYPLLTFMDKYGFWGGKWNIGYGRLKVEEIEMRGNNGFEEVTNWKKEEFVFSKFCKDNNSKFENKKFSDFIQSRLNFTDLENKNSKILYKLENQIVNNNFSAIIKELIKKKAKERFKHKNDIKNNELRHRLFGTTSGGGEGTKIIPWISEEDGQIKTGFVSIAGILNIKR